MTTDAHAKYSTADVAERCGVTRRQAQRIIRSVLGERTRYRLTQEEFDRVRSWHSIWGYKRLSERLTKKRVRQMSDVVLNA